MNNIIWIVLTVCLIVVLVMVLKRVIPGLKNNDEEIDEATSIEQEVNRYIVTPEENKEKEDDDEE